MRRLGRFFKYLFRDIMDLSIAVTFIGLALMAGGLIYNAVLQLTGPALVLLVAKVTVIAFTVMLVTLVIEGEYRFIRALKNGTFRRHPKPTPTVNIYHYCDNCDSCGCDENEDEEPEEDYETDESEEDIEDDPVED